MIANLNEYRREFDRPVEDPPEEILARVSSGSTIDQIVGAWWRSFHSGRPAHLALPSQVVAIEKPLEEPQQYLDTWGRLLALELFQRALTALRRREDYRLDHRVREIEIHVLHARARAGRELLDALPVADRIGHVHALVRCATWDWIRAVTSDDSAYGHLLHRYGIMREDALEGSLFSAPGALTLSNAVTGVFDEVDEYDASTHRPAPPEIAEVRRFLQWLLEEWLLPRYSLALARRLVRALARLPRPVDSHGSGAQATGHWSRTVEEGAQTSTIRDLAAPGAALLVVLAAGLLGLESEVVLPVSLGLFAVYEFARPRVAVDLSTHLTHPMFVVTWMVTAVTAVLVPLPWSAHALAASSALLGIALLGALIGSIRASASVAYVLLPRMGAGVVLGAILALTLPSDVSNAALGLGGEPARAPLSPGGLVLTAFALFAASLLYLIAEVRRKVGLTDRVAPRRPTDSRWFDPIFGFAVRRAVPVFLIGVAQAIIAGSTVSAMLVSSALANPSHAAKADQFARLGGTEILVHPIHALFASSIALFGGVVMQMLWETQATTEPIV